MAKKLTDKAYDTLLEWLFESLKYLARKHNVLPGELFNFTRKSRAISAARSDLTTLARRHIGVRRSSENTQELHVFPKGVAQANDGMDPAYMWKPLSFRQVSCLLGVTASALSQAQTKRLKESAKEKVLTPEEGNGSEGTIEQEHDG